MSFVFVFSVSTGGIYSDSDTTCYRPPSLWDDNGLGAAEEER
jgi:mannosyltransferase OCH1-like enzyme